MNIIEKNNYKKIKSSEVGTNTLHDTEIVIDGGKIVNAYCDCVWGQNNRNAWKEGKTVCKHIKNLVFKVKNNKRRKIMDVGKERLTKKEKEVLKGLTNNKCQKCGKPAEEIHRIKRGNEGGKYSPNNLLILCGRCHKKFHSCEKGIKGK